MILNGHVFGRFDSTKYSYEQSRQQTPHQQPEIIGEPLVLCTSRFMIITVQTSKPLVGRIYVEDREFDERCSAEFSPSNSHNATIRIPILPCLIIDELLSQNKDQLFIWAYMRINFHQVLVTGQSRLFRVECSSLTKNQVLDDVQQPG
ncbi:Calsequestrin [Aphelenchoides bicaudatus]|nr:Calsequestrin [Aphelenchoides bicaudatus]